MSDAFFKIISDEYKAKFLYEFLEIAFANGCIDAATHHRLNCLRMELSFNHQNLILENGKIVARLVDGIIVENTGGIDYAEVNSGLSLSLRKPFRI